MLSKQANTILWILVIQLIGSTTKLKNRRKSKTMQKYDLYLLCYTDVFFSMYFCHFAYVHVSNYNSIAFFFSCNTSMSCRRLLLLFFWGGYHLDLVQIHEFVFISLIWWQKYDILTFKITFL